MADELADGVLEDRADGRCALRFERRLAHPVAAVWAALTEPGQLLGWWGVADELDLTEGGAFVLRWLNTDTDGNTAVLHGTVSRLEPPHLLEFDTDLHGVLRFELRAEGGGTHLVFTSENAAPPEVRPLLLAGWQLHLAFLAGHLAGDRNDLVHLPMDRWQRWHDAYAARLSG